MSSQSFGDAYKGKENHGYASTNHPAAAVILSLLKDLAKAEQFEGNTPLAITPQKLRILESFLQPLV